MPNGTGLDRFQPHHPDKYFDVGIAEEHAVIFAAGLATQGIQALLRDLLHVPAARLRSHRSRRLPAESAGGLLHGSRRPLGRRRSHASRPVRHQLSARHSEHGPHGAEGRGRARGHAVHRHAVERPHRGALSARRRPRHAGEGRAARHSRSARRNCCSTATTIASRSSRSGALVPMAEEIAAQARRAKAFPRR